MWTKEKIDSFMAGYGFKPQNTKSEVKELPNILHPDEELHGLLNGFLKQGKNNDSLGVLIATNKRIIFYRKSIIGTVTKEEIPIRMITSSMYRKGLMTSAVAIITANNETVVDCFDKKETERFSEIVNKLVSEHHNTIKNNAQPKQAQLSNLEQLEKLFELKQKGIITEEEFNQQKLKLL